MTYPICCAPQMGSGSDKLLWLAQSVIRLRSAGSLQALVCELVEVSSDRAHGACVRSCGSCAIKMDSLVLAFGWTCSRRLCSGRWRRVLPQIYRRAVRGRHAKQGLGSCREVLHLALAPHRR